MTNILEFLEQTAKRLPDKTAFADVNASLTFSQLEKQSRSIGTALQRLSSPREPVVFFLEKSTLCVAGFLGAVYAGCFYTLIDPKLPASRVASILDTLQASVLCTDEQHREQAQALPFRGSLVVLEDIRNTFPDHSALLRIRELAADTDPLYAIFTSGSTGVPKGVAVCHRSVLDFIPQFTALMGIEEEDVLGNQAPFDFDVSVKDIYSALYSGATVHIIPRAYFSFPTKLMDYLCERRVTTLVWAVSAMCFVSTMRGFDYRVPADVRKVIFSGEVMPVKHLNIWRTFLPRAKYFNVYGPTEITCNCTYYAIERSFSEEEILPIGRPFPNERVFLLDEEDHLVTAPGALGELCVSGTALALGYYNDPERTAQVFVQNPLHHRYPETIYRTGDLARYDQDGNLVYVSRKDFQIKHMGHRIELGEIDAVLGRQRGVERACCLYYPEKQRLLAFYLGSAEKRELFAALRQILPGFMLPNALIPCTGWPLTKNGKTDRARLLADYLERG